MAGGTIGKAALVLTTSDSGLGRGLDGAYGKLQGFKNSVIGSFSKLSLAGGATALLGGGKIVGDLIGSIKEKADLSKEAKALGLPVASFQALKAAAESAGVDTNGLKEALINMSGKVSSAAGGNAALSASFAKVGLNAQALKGMGMDQQFLQIADALAAVPNAGDRAQLALQLLGEEAGKKLLPILSQGSAAVKKFADEQKRTGQALSESDAAKIQAAAKAMPRIAAAFDGVWTRITVAAAPIIEKLAGVATKILGKLQPVFTFFADTIGTYYEVLGGVLGEILDLGGELLSELGNFLGEIFNVGEMKSTREYVLDFFEGIGIAGGYVWDTLKAGAGAIVIGFAHISEAMDPIREGMIKLIEMAGKLPDDLGGGMFRRVAEEMRASLPRGKAMLEDLKAWGKRQIDGFGNSEGQVTKWFDKLRAGKDEVKGAAEAVNAAAENLSMSKMKDNKAIERGSKEDYSARVQWEFSTEQDKQIQEQRKIVNNTKQTADALRDVASQLGRVFAFGGV